MPVHVTSHAIERYQQRVEPVSEEVARKRLSAIIIERATVLPVKAKGRRLRWRQDE